MSRNGCTTSDIEVLEKIIEMGKPSLEDISKRTGTSKTAILKHIVSLEKEGFLERKYESSGRGRPVCHISVKAPTIQEEAYPDPMNEALLFMESRMGKESLMEFVDQFNEKAESYLRNLFENKDIHEKLSSFARIRNSEGFLTTVNYGADGDFTIFHRTCPISRFVKKNGSICEREEELFKGVFDMDCTREGNIAMGSSACAFIMSPRKIGPTR